MAIIVILPNALRPLAANNERVPFEAATVGDALKQLIERYPDVSAKLPGDWSSAPHGAALYRNGLDVRYTGGLDTELRSGDRVTIIVPEGDL